MSDVVTQPDLSADEGNVTFGCVAVFCVFVVADGYEEEEDDGAEEEEVDDDDDGDFPVAAMNIPLEKALSFRINVPLTKKRKSIPQWEFS